MLYIVSVEGSPCNTHVVGLAGDMWPLYEPTIKLVVVGIGYLILIR